jgi:hypothetical protein
MEMRRFMVMGVEMEIEGKGDGNEEGLGYG